MYTSSMHQATRCFLHCTQLTEYLEETSIDIFHLVIWLCLTIFKYYSMLFCCIVFMKRAQNIISFWLILFLQFCLGRLKHKYNFPTKLQNFRYSGSLESSFLSIYLGLVRSQASQTHISRNRSNINDFCVRIE